MKVVMKGTIITLAIIVTLLLTWLFLGFISYLLNDLTFKQSLQSWDLGLISFLLGGIFSIIVYCDLDNYLK